MRHEQLDGQLKLAPLDPLQGQSFGVRKRDGHFVRFDERRVALGKGAKLAAAAALYFDLRLTEHQTGGALTW